MTTYVRALARCKKEDKSDYLLHFDVRLQDGRISRRQPVYGWQHGFGDSMPFILLSDGQVDFGTRWGPDRFGQTDVLDVAMAIGSELRWWGHDWNETYSIVSIKSLEELV